VERIPRGKERKEGKKSQFVIEHGMDVEEKLPEKKDAWRWKAHG
jgi:hypothetical protein